MVGTMGIDLPRKVKICEPISGIAEIRLRAGRPAVYVDLRGGMKICSERLTVEDIADYFAEICRFSVHSYQEEIAGGYVTLDGGHRVGICGTAVRENGRISFLKDISGLNIRVAHAVNGCSDGILDRVGECSMLIAGKPMSGKTTILRDLARRLGEQRRVTVIDSRGEIAAAVHGLPSFDVGLNTDVLSGFEKSEGIMMALRSLSPEFIICDEIAHDEKAVEQALFCGVKIIASVHAGSAEEVDRRLNGLAEMFDSVVVIGGRGKILDIQRNGVRS